MATCIKDIDHDVAFDYLSDEESSFLEKNKSSLKYNKGEVILKQGTFANNILFVRTGLCKIYIQGTQKKVILTLKKEKNFLGITSLYYDKKLYLYSASAIEDCEIDFYDKESFKQVMRNNALFSNEIVKYLNYNSVKIYGRIACLAEKNARGKVADMLLCFANNLFGCLEFTVPLSRQDLAEFADLSMENTIRILKEFEKDGLISVDGKTIAILNVEALERIRQFG
ncbi:MAG: Crp/Fnr family transcriptional regulator [Deltaproteobacteria bacterium]